MTPPLTDFISTQLLTPLLLVFFRKCGADEGPAPADDLRVNPRSSKITPLLESVRAASDNPILHKLEPELSLLVAELEAFLQEAQDKNKYSQTSRGSAELLRAATESLRTLLTSLDLTIEAVTGGSKSPSYRMWAATAQGMTG